MTEQQQDTEASCLTSDQTEGATAAFRETEESESPLEIDVQDLNFDLQLVLDGFTQCKGDDGQLYLDGYLRAYSELNK